MRLNGENPVRKRKLIAYLLCARQGAFMCNVLCTLLLVPLCKKKKIIFRFAVSSYVVVSADFSE